MVPSNIKKLVNLSTRVSCLPPQIAHRILTTNVLYVESYVITIGVRDEILGPSPRHHYFSEFLLTLRLSTKPIGCNLNILFGHFVSDEHAKSETRRHDP